MGIRTPRVTAEAVLAAAKIAVTVAAGVRIHMTLRRFEALAQERQRLNTLIQYRRDHQALIRRAMEDPALLPVLDAFEDDLPDDTQRRHLFANDLYQHALHGYRIGVLKSQEELRGHLRFIFQSPAMRAYWEATRHHRASLADDSDEASLGRMTDRLVTALKDEADEEWWVVGKGQEGVL